MNEMKPRLHFKRPRNEQGRVPARSSCGWDLWCGDQAVGGAYPLMANWPLRGITGYYWCCSNLPDLGIELRNTASRPVETMGEARVALHAYVEARLKKAGLR